LHKAGPPPLESAQLDRINWSLRGLDNLSVRRRHPPCPPITLAMLRALKATIQLSDPFNACVWAMAACAFFGMMRFGEVSVSARTAFKPDKHITRGMAIFGTDMKGAPYACLDLPVAKTAKPGEVQSVFLNEQDDLCPLAALHNMAARSPATAIEPLFSWLDKTGTARLMVKAQALDRINTILLAWGWGTQFRHSFRIGGTSFYLARKVDPEIVRLAGRWKSLTYQVYIRAFKQVASQHLANKASIDDRAGPSQVGLTAAGQPQRASIG